VLSQRHGFHLLQHSAPLLEARLRDRLQQRIDQALAKESGLTAASMSTMTKRWLEAGLIERQVDQREIRSNVLRLSDHGKSLLETIRRDDNKEHRR